MAAFYITYYHLDCFWYISCCKLYLYNISNLTSSCFGLIHLIKFHSRLVLEELFISLGGRYAVYSSICFN